MRSGGFSPLQTISNASQEEGIEKRSSNGLLDLIDSSFAFCVAALPSGAALERGGINFPIFSKHATGVTLVLYKPGIPEPMTGFPRDPSINRTGNIWRAFVSVIDPGIQCEYRMKLGDIASQGSEPRLPSQDSRLLQSRSALELSGERGECA